MDQKVFIVNIGTVWKYVVPIQNCGLLWIFTNLVWQEMRLKIWIIRKESFSLMVLKGIKTFRLSSAISKGTGMSKILVGQAYLMICQLPPPLKVNVAVKKWWGPVCSSVPDWYVGRRPLRLEKICNISTRPRLKRFMAGNVLNRPSVMPNLKKGARGKHCRIWTSLASATSLRSLGVLQRKTRLHEMSAF